MGAWRRFNVQILTFKGSDSSKTDHGLPLVGPSLIAESFNLGSGTLSRAWRSYQCLSTTLIQSSSALSASWGVPPPPASSRCTRTRCIFCKRTASSRVTSSLSIPRLSKSGNPREDQGRSANLLFNQSSMPCSQSTNTSRTLRLPAAQPVSARLKVRTAWPSGEWCPLIFSFSARFANVSRRSNAISKCTELLGSYSMG